MESASIAHWGEECGGGVEGVWRRCGGDVEEVWRGCGGGVEGVDSARGAESARGGI